MANLLKQISNQSEVSEIADFVLEYGDGLYNADERYMIEQYVAEHMRYGTLMVIRDKVREIVAAVRWNWLSHDKARILDLVIRPDYRHKHLLKDMLIKAKLAMPRLQALTFYRKRNGRLESTTHLIEQYLGDYHGKR